MIPDHYPKMTLAVRAHHAQKWVRSSPRATSRTTKPLRNQSLLFWPPGRSWSSTFIDVIIGKHQGSARPFVQKLQLGKTRRASLAQTSVCMSISTPSLNPDNCIRLRQPKTSPIYERFFQNRAKTRCLTSCCKQAPNFFSIRLEELVDAKVHVLGRRISSEVPKRSHRSFMPSFQPLGRNGQPR